MPEPLHVGELKTYRLYNGMRLEDWLSTWASSSKGKPKTHPDELIHRDGFGPQGPGGISMARMEALLSEDICRTDRLLQGVVDELDRRHGDLYRNLTPVYWDANASDGYLEFWRNSSLEAHRERYERAGRALGFMLVEAEKSLAYLGRKRLVVLAPWHSTKMARDLVEAEQRYAVDVYFKKLEEAELDGERNGWSTREVVGEAVRRTAIETDYSPQWIRRLRSELNPLKSA